MFEKTSQIFFLFVFLLHSSLFSLTAQAKNTDPEYEKRKAEFLKTPVFKANREREAQKLKKDSANNSTESYPESGSSYSQTLQQPDKGKPVQESERNNILSNLTSPSDKENGNCGTNAYVKNYCYYKTGENRWLLCTGKWGGCITKSKNDFP